MRNRKRSKANHRCQKATKQVKGQMDGRGDKELYALNIQMFIDASIRNGFDTLKTILKFFLFKIYTSEASKRRSWSCCDSVQSAFLGLHPKSHWSTKSTVTRFSFPQQRGRVPQLHHHPEPLVKSHTQLSAFGCVRSVVQLSLVCEIRWF